LGRKLIIKQRKKQSKLRQHLNENTSFDQLPDCRFSLADFDFELAKAMRFLNVYFYEKQQHQL
jgi:hypothetical protein